MTSPAQVVLVIMDGWGKGPQAGNAILAADTPNIDKLNRTYPAATLAASGSQVGLPVGQMGNSE
ncbi:MAG TPA: 2,3-bisphosphoglycerate-independent phosphoglycerate mutase, partial [Firmicutes bacterium]|nr:2,3-bisphosphoglycerate-independent phosphoglycerate mutase [Bacillota bacterium]